MVEVYDTLSIALFEKQIRDFFLCDWSDSFICGKNLSKIFKLSCFNSTECQQSNDIINRKIIDFSRKVIAGKNDFETFKHKMKSYDFSATCSMVWKRNDFAYRCRTCQLSTNMSLCAICFQNGTHVGHDFNIYKSFSGGACDCGSSSLIRESGNCCNHGPSKLSLQRGAPEALVEKFKIVIPIYLKCFLFSTWSLMSNGTDHIPEQFTNNFDALSSTILFLNELLTYGLIAQQIITEIITDEVLFNNFVNECKSTREYRAFVGALAVDPKFTFPPTKFQSQQLYHNCILDGIIFVCIKLRFPDDLVNFFIGLLPIEKFQEIFVHSYLNHYPHIFYTLMMYAQSSANVEDSCYAMNTKLSNLSVQIYGREETVLKMINERHLHYHVVYCLFNILKPALTRLDTNDNKVINCESSIVKNRVLDPLIKNLKYILSHKSAVNVFITDLEFMSDFVKLLKWMQFMNFYALKGGNNLEYDSISYYFAFHMEIEISSVFMWKIWYHYQLEDDRERVLKLVDFFISTLAEFIDTLGTFRVVLLQDQIRKPLSFHLPLMRNVACFLSLALFHYNLPLSCLLQNINKKQMIRWFTETTNVLLGCQEIAVGYWSRNGDDIQTSKRYYTFSKYCYGLIDMDIFGSQICASVIPSAVVLYILTDPTLLLKGITFNVKQSAPRKYVCSHFLFDETDVDIHKKSLALETWLINLCLLLDLRNKMNVSENVILRKEVCTKLFSGPIKRSDLKKVLPIRIGLHNDAVIDLDAILIEVSNFTAPSYEEYSGRLKSGYYTFRDNLWDTEYDPLFQSLRSISKQESMQALSKYREYYRQKENVARPDRLWPPYRIPQPQHCQLLQLEDILQCKDLTYIIFCSLYMFLNNNATVSEDSLALIIHLIHRALITGHSRNIPDVKRATNRYPSNPYKVNNILRNIRYNVDIELEDNGGSSLVVTKESIISLLLTIHAKLNTDRTNIGTKTNMVYSMLPSKDDNCHKLSLAYKYSKDSIQRAKETGLGINWGDGVDFIGHLLDVIVSMNDENSKYLLALLDKRQRMDIDRLTQSLDCQNAFSEDQINTGLPKFDNISNKRKALERREGLVANMIMKQKMFAESNHLDEFDTNVKVEDEEMFTCVICQQQTNGKAGDMALLGVIISASPLKYMKDRVELIGCVGRVIHRKDYVGMCSIDARILSNSVVIQTCGHMVHLECFNKYRAHKIANVRFLGSILCPLCRRDVHHLMPIQVQENKTYSSHEFYSCLKGQLLKSLHAQHCDIKTNIIDDTIANMDVLNISNDHQACVLLMGQLELELVVCLTVPEQYGTVIKRCHWPEFMAYIRSINHNVRSLIKQSDYLFGTSFCDELCFDDIDNYSNVDEFLSEVPSDVFLNFIPYVWPYEDQFMNILNACVVMAYIKGMVMIGSMMHESQYYQWCHNEFDNDAFKRQFSLVLRRCKQICTGTVNVGYIAQDAITADLFKCILPLLRIAAVLKLRLLKLEKIPITFPLLSIDSTKNIDCFTQFKGLCEFLNLSHSDSSSQDCEPYILNIFSTCLRSTMYINFEQVVSKYVNDGFIDFYFKENQRMKLNNTILNMLNLGNELYPPQLIEMPSNYHDLFNTYHSQQCHNTSKEVIHNFPENGLCLICGDLICLVCKSLHRALKTHSITCCNGIGILVEINSSIIYVLVHNQISRWGSIYLDNYGEEDLDLKRGRPLSMNCQRFKLLEQQWLTHSFKHALKDWKMIL